VTELEKKFSFFKGKMPQDFPLLVFPKIGGAPTPQPLIPFRFLNFPKNSRECRFFKVLFSSLREKKIFWNEMLFFY
jgi:hypothetical protein